MGFAVEVPPGSFAGVYKKPGFYIVEIVETRRVVDSAYIEVAFPTEKEALDERAELLKYFGPKNPWRRRLCIRRLDGSIFNPEFPEVEKRFPPPKRAGNF